MADSWQYKVYVLLLNIFLMFNSSKDLALFQSFTLFYSEQTIRHDEPKILT